MPALKKPILNLITGYLDYLEEKSAEEQKTKVQVDAIASRLAVFYEKIRNLIDYQEAHLIRKGVIARAFRRRVFFKDWSGKSDLGEAIVREVVRSGYFGFSAITEEKIKETQEIIETFLEVLEELKKSQNKEKEIEWFTEMTVCAIEDCLVSFKKEDLLARAMFQVLGKGLEVQNTVIPKEAEEILLFAAIQKSLFKTDADQVSYKLLNFLEPEFGRKKAEAKETAERLTSTRKIISDYLKHPHLPAFQKFCGRQAIVFHIIGDLVFGGRNFENLEGETKTVYAERRLKEKEKLTRLAFFSVISFLLSKILIALAIEIPIDIYILNQFSLPHTAASIIFPPFLMFLIVSSIRLPSEKNLNLILEEVKAAAFEEERKYTVSVPRKKSGFVKSAVQIFYFLVFGLALYFLSRMLLRLGFSGPSIAVFVLFTSLVTATGLKIYNRAKEMSLEKAPARFFGFILDLITVPLAAIGRQLISGLKRFNVLIIAVNLFIELPIQLFLELLEHFNEFVRSKKEEIE